MPPLFQMNKKLKRVAKNILLACGSIIIIVSPVAAKEISGVQIPEQASLSNNIQLKLNGAGIRSKFFFDIYIGAIYLENTTKSAQEIISSIGANRMLMHFLYDEVPKEKITSGWTNGFEDNNSKQELKTLTQALDNFNALFINTKKGDVILMDYIPHTGTEVRINNELKGTIPGEKFNQALRKVWLGNDPADSDLKEALLNLQD